MYAIPRSRPIIPLPWLVIALTALGLWLGACLLLDLAILPSFYWTGMMATADFPQVGASIFGLFNRMELVMGSLVLTSLLAAAYGGWLRGGVARTCGALAMVMLAVAALETYVLTPDMVSLSAQLVWPAPMEAVPVTMDRMHGLYFALDGLKVLAGMLLLGLGYRSYGPRSLPQG
ncbi:MAG: hypothetical protein Fur0042_00620 [Cyanophyceae cyanobacterium]